MLLVWNESLVHAIKVNVDVRIDSNPLWLMSSSKERNCHTRYVRRVPCDKGKVPKKIAISQQGHIFKCYFCQSRKTLNQQHVTKSKYVKTKRDAVG